MEAKFYKHDSYLTIRRKFTGAWTNLRLELHEQSAQFWKEGDDEFEDDDRFFSTETADELLFTLTGGTTKSVARRLFSDYYSLRGKSGNCIEASIVGNFAGEVSYPSETDVLDECNNPFYLPLNKFVYAEFKRRFATRWTNLSIEVYPVELPDGELPPDTVQLADDFEMRKLERINRLVIFEYYERDGVRAAVKKIANESVLRDETYLADFENSLRNSGISVRIKNQRLGIYWEGKLNYPQLKQFQAAGKIEDIESNLK